MRWAWRAGPGRVRGGGPRRLGREVLAAGSAAGASRRRRPGRCPVTSPRSPGGQLELRAAGRRVAAGRCGRGGGHPRDRRDGRDRQDRVRGARRAPAGGPVPRRADLPAAARAHARAAAGRPGRRAGQPAADRRGPGRADPARRWRRGWRCGGTGWPGRQLLLVLDDAASSEQVRPLLPGAGGSLVLVTSRRHLTALEDATAVSLDTLPPGEAAALLVRLAARPGLQPGRSGGGRDHPAVRVPAAGDRDGGPPAAPPPGLDRWPGGPPSWPRRGTGWS